MKIEMTYEEFCELRDTADKAKAELDLLQKAIKRIYGPDKSRSLLDDYAAAIEYDNRARLQDLVRAGKL